VVLVDSSVWILAERHRFAITQLLPPEEQVAICPIIFQEVVRGAADEAGYLRIRRVLLAAEMLDASVPFERFEQAARVFFDCRKAGVTPRSSVDCLVAATAIAHDVAVLHDDRDFEHIARVLSLKTSHPLSR